MTWTASLHKASQKDVKKIALSCFKAKAQTLMSILEKDQWLNPPSLEKLVDDLSCLHFRRINIQLCLVYQELEAEQTLKILQLLTHGE